MQIHTQIKRIASNYIRMVITFLCGIWLLRLLLQFGDGVYAAVALTGSSIGIAEILKEMIRGATIPILGTSYHKLDKSEFKHVFSSTALLSIVAAIFSALILSLFILFIGHFNIAENLEKATIFYISTRIIYVFIAISASPILNMLPITDRMISYNIWLTIERSGEVISALAVTYLIATNSDADELIQFSILSASFMTVIVRLATAYTTRLNNQFFPKFKHASLERIKSISKTIGWNGAAVVSVNLYLRFDLLLINLFYGVQATVIFGLASQLAAYTRILTMGLITGLDAVVTQNSSLNKNEFNVNTIELSKNILRLQTLVLGFAVLVIVFHSTQIIELLFSSQVKNSTVIPSIVLSFQILMIGMLARSLSEGWMSILAGSGKIKEYAIPVFYGSLLNPVIVIIIVSLISETAGLTLIAITFLTLNVVFHMGVVPVIMAREFKTTMSNILSPLVIPVTLTITGVILILVINRYFDFSSGLSQFATTLIIASLCIAPYTLYSFIRLLRANILGPTKI